MYEVELKKKRKKMRVSLWLSRNVWWTSFIHFTWWRKFLKKKNSPSLRLRSHTMQHNVKCMFHRTHFSFFFLFALPWIHFHILCTWNAWIEAFLLHVGWGENSDDKLHFHLSLCSSRKKRRDSNFSFETSNLRYSVPPHKPYKWWCTQKNIPNS